jgi:hypothetical protein
MKRNDSLRTFGGLSLLSRGALPASGARWAKR